MFLSKICEEKKDFCEIFCGNLRVGRKNVLKSSSKYFNLYKKVKIFFLNYVFCLKIRDF
jgi:hypothetical protein